jgi:hypothetical protein
LWNFRLSFLSRLRMGGIISRASLATEYATDLILGIRGGQGMETNTAGTGALRGRLPEQEV